MTKCTKYKTTSMMDRDLKRIHERMKIAYAIMITGLLTSAASLTLLACVLLGF